VLIDESLVKSGRLFQTVGPERDARLCWPSWLATYRDGWLTITHPCTNRTRRRITLSLRQTANENKPRTLYHTTTQVVKRCNPPQISGIGLTAAIGLSAPQNPTTYPHPNTDPNRSFCAELRRKETHSKRRQMLTI